MWAHFHISAYTSHGGVGGHYIACMFNSSRGWKWHGFLFCAWDGNSVHQFFVIIYINGMSGSWGMEALCAVTITLVIFACLSETFERVGLHHNCFLHAHEYTWLLPYPWIHYILKWKTKYNSSRHGWVV